MSSSNAASGGANGQPHQSRRGVVTDNLTSLHRLCTAAGEDCERVGEALDPSS